ncbi:MAG: ATP-binding cassette domain-containing protein [Aquamicrobium sp.]|uniref:ABC transporter ATP-binding protein n=1 Tax=Aquamicrobium sp. TaxID=1872579 RepID=UPI00349E8811|nr:ATP-binding cassette domain-containing protein [Aquamicrobium sp.]
MTLALTHVTKRFGNTVALDDISLTVERGEFICFLGPSGCGKTTLLRIVAGLELAEEGTVTLDGRDLSETPARNRNFGVVFQSYSLFPNMTAARNVGYGLECRKRPRAEIEARAAEMLRIVALSDHAHKLPSQLSGGQQQRVALARALAPDPDVLLLDEPLSALDAKVRESLRLEIRDLQKRLGITTIMVTHDQEEALTMADRIVVMDTGHIAQVGTARELYDRPASKFVAEFIGRMNVLPLDGGRFAGRPVALPEERQGVKLIGIRPEDVRLHAGAAAAGDGFLPARLRNIIYLGNLAHLVLDVEGADNDIVAEIPGHAFRELANAPQIAVELPRETIKVLE